MTITDFYMTEIAFKVTKPRRKKSHSANNSTYREDKTVAHITINGIGKIGKLRKRRK